MTKTLTIAFAVTLLDAVTIAHYGPAVWQAWGSIPWSRVALLIVVGTGVFTLADIWSISISSPLLWDRPEQASPVSEGATIASEPLGEAADV